MERFLNKNVFISTCLDEANGSISNFKGVVTSFDDEYVCLDNYIYIVRKFIVAIILK